MVLLTHDPTFSHLQASVDDKELFTSKFLEHIIYMDQPLPEVSPQTLPKGERNLEGIRVEKKNYINV
jgi:hypothetical protein